MPENAEPTGTGPAPADPDVGITLDEATLGHLGAPDPGFAIVTP